jgi:predicted nucleic-acid-binding protein
VVLVIAVDTNVVVRLLVNDDERQGSKARGLFESNEVWIGANVLLETAWVLESVYGLHAPDVAESLSRLLGLPNVQVENPVAVASALAAARQGVQLADALHLCRAPDGIDFTTFDRALAKAGRELRAIQLL